MHRNPSIFGRCGACKWRRSLSSPFSLDAGPLRQQAARACPGVTLRGGCGQEQGAHSAAAAASGQPTGWPGVGGREETDKGRERLGVGRAETETQRETKRQRDTETERQKGGSCLGCTSASLVPQVKGLKLAQPLVRLQPPKVFLVQLKSRPKRGLRGHQGRHPKQPLSGGMLWALRDTGPGFEY